MIVVTDELLRQAAQAYTEDFLASLPDPSECNHVFSEEYERKKRKLIKTYKYFGFCNGVKKVACFFIAFILSASMVLAVHDEARAAVLGWIEDRVGDFYHYFFAGEGISEETKGLDVAGNIGVAEETVNEENIMSYSLGWVPEGYSYVTSIDRENGKTIVYSSQDGEIMQFVFVYGSDTYSVYMGHGEYQEEHVSADGLEANIFLALDVTETNFIVWENDAVDVVFSITSYAGKEELMKMALHVVAEDLN